MKQYNHNQRDYDYLPQPFVPTLVGTQDKRPQNTQRLTTIFKRVQTSIAKLLANCHQMLVFGFNGMAGLTKSSSLSESSVPLWLNPYRRFVIQSSNLLRKKRRS